MIKVIIADDHVIFRQGLLKLLQTAEDITVAGEAGEGREALRLIEEEKPDVAMLDISMPGLSGLSITDEIQHRGIGTKGHLSYNAQRSSHCKKGHPISVGLCVKG